MAHPLKRKQLLTGICMSWHRLERLCRTYADRSVACLREVKRYRPLIAIGASLDKQLAPLRQHVDLNAALADPPASDKKEKR
jgi:hypothetical protein